MENIIQKLANKEKKYTKQDVLNIIEEAIHNFFIYKITKQGVFINEEDNTYSCDKDVDISDMALTKIPIQFKIVKGSFNCSKNLLKNLQGCPTVVKGNFLCYDNNLTSLQYITNVIEGNLDCHTNKLTFTQCCPKNLQVKKEVFKDLLCTKYCSNNMIDNKECSSNELLSTEYMPSKINGNLICYDNPRMLSKKIKVSNTKGEICDICGKVIK